MPPSSPSPQAAVGLAETLPSDPQRPPPEGLAETLPSDPQRGSPAGPVVLDAPLVPGQAVGEYVVEGTLGVGAFGTVYAARHPLIGKTAAIKVLSLRCSADPELVARFVDEARAVNKIQHPGIIDIFSFGQLADGRHYSVMERLAGGTLLEALQQRGAFPLAEALPILEGIAAALQAAHEVGIAHRDLKPANVFVVASERSAGSSGGVKLLDFGVAKLLASPGDGSARTASGATVGTPAYMAPEQCVAGSIDHRVDIYAFGVLAFHLLTGRLPFEADNSFGMMAAHVSRPAPLAHSVAPDLPPALSRALQRLMAKAPEDRPPTMTAAMASLTAAVPVSAQPSRPKRRLGRVAAALAVGAAGFGLWLRPDQPLGSHLRVELPEVVGAAFRRGAARPPAPVVSPAPPSIAPAVAADTVPSAAPATEARPAGAARRIPEEPRVRAPATRGRRGEHEIEPW